ncbi:phosphoglycerate mutase [Fragilaria crotonensis]|nr:phosphoglycerate mutase [Fragilaria crotonensis]
MPSLQACVFLLVVAISESFVVNPTWQRDSWFLLSTQNLPEVQVVSSMPEPIPMDLNNEYYLLRHGQSTANVAGVISSARSLAYSTKHGLTEFGYQQGFDAADQVLELVKDSSKKKVIFVSSPFARAHQTAQACLDGLATKDVGSLEIDTTIRIQDNLMERFFGRLDDEAIYTYAYVWPVDKFNVTHTAFGVESVAAVATRLRQVIMTLEEELPKEGSHVILVSHADVLQICQLYAAGVDNVGIFSSYRFGNGEVRKMARTPESLPDPSPLQAPDRDTKTKAS